MKGIIIEKNIDSYVLLLSDGDFKTVESATDLDIGSVVSGNGIIGTSSLYAKRIALMVASFLLVIAIGIGVYAWESPVQYISIDINPSVELSINCFYRIISVNSPDDEGKRLVESISIQTQSYENGINEIISSAKNLGYINDKDNVLISLSSKDEKFNERTQATILEKVSENVKVMTFDTEAYYMSAKSGISPGKNTIIEEVLASGADLSKEDLAEEPVQDLIKRLDDSKKGSMMAEGKVEEHRTEEQGAEERRAEEQKAEIKRAEEQRREEEKRVREEQKEREKKEKEERKQEMEKQKALDAVERQRTEGQRTEEQRAEKQKAEIKRVEEQRREEEKRLREEQKEREKKEKEERKQGLENEKEKVKEKAKDALEKQEKDALQKQKDKDTLENQEKDEWKKELKKKLDEKKQEWQQFIEEATRRR